jgi:hypothetical protein
LASQTKPQRVILFKLPDRFYWESSTSMSSLYQVLPGDIDREHQPIRWSWSDVGTAADQGQVVEIQPADAQLWRWAEATLLEIKAALSVSDKRA